MTIQVRTASGYDDLIVLRQFVAHVQACYWPSHARWHPGELSWYWFQNHFHGQNTFRMWESESRDVLAMVCLWTGSPEVWMLSPCILPDANPTLDVISWVIREQEQAKNPPTLVQQVLETDSVMIREVEAQGFKLTSEIEYLMERDLTLPVVEPIHKVVGITSDWQFADRLEVQHEEWHPNLTVELYRELRKIPGYDERLDMIAETDNGRYAAYGIAWFDAINRMGMFDPVATLKHYRRQGYGQAVMLGLCEQLKKMGARLARVQCGEHNVPFYASTGFTVATRWLTYERKAT